MGNAMIAGEILCMQGKLMTDLNNTAAEANTLQAKLIVTEAAMAQSEAINTYKAGLMQANGQAISGSLGIAGGAAGIAGGCVSIAGNVGELRELNALDQVHPEQRALVLSEPDAAPIGGQGAAGRDPGLSDERLGFERAKIETSYKSKAALGQMLMQSVPSLLSQGLASMFQSFFTAEGAKAQADAQMCGSTGKALAGIRASIDAVAQGAQSMFGQIANNTSQTLQYVVALSQAH